MWGESKGFFLLSHSKKSSPIFFLLLLKYLKNIYLLIFIKSYTRIFSKVYRNVKTDRLLLSSAAASFF